ncbi:putative DNA repair protein RAD1 [Taphrina deformans PYCC 5710]|uniref:DNA repair protein RAD1 n=1 Tax=Taphrina deformans (strain PYCC 5710 / ATCC 11124 / CBS 356.35 / IMI 108563 / JCM 9778 / NBRC 8474) TaxID=1097556 RepID=R4X8E8_TAPDE|nr:putative DNA repair protein RAD1 [Taphrina deformans PYCC 5710]|eukprot:CCG81858.1 putative DNA repair protein RAD1 [Taphrina deformans PYCC 5710]
MPESQLQVLEDVQLTLPLKFQQKVLQDIYSSDGLVILARGLGLPSIIANLLHTLNRPESLVIILGADRGTRLLGCTRRLADVVEDEQIWLGEQMIDFPGGLRAPLNVINSDATSVGQRERMYKRGGLFSVTSRILIVDFLTSIIDPALVAGIVVMRAEKVSATSMEAFILRIFRQKNKEGFIKAFSDQPEPFATGFAPLANTMKNLFVRSAYLWPRFHKDVAENLERRKADVIELEVLMTPAMRDIQIAILECIEAVMGELKKANSQQLDLEDWSTDAALHRNFDQLVRRQLDPVWHRVSFRSKQLVSDLTSLRSLLHALLNYDCVSFNRLIEGIFETNNSGMKAKHQDQSAWLFLEAANTIFTLARHRVYKSASNTDTPVGVLPYDLEPTLEEQPKWEQLAEAIKEIHDETHFNPPKDDANDTILIMCSDQKTCTQIKQYLETMHNSDDKESQGKSLLRSKFRDYLNWKQTAKAVNEELFREKNDQEKAQEAQKRGVTSSYRGRGAPPNKRRRVRGGSTTASATGRPEATNRVVDLTAMAESMIDAEPLDKHIDPLEEEDATDGLEDYFGLLDLNDLIIVMPYEGDADDHLLEDFRPRHVIMYELDPAFIRRIEIYRAKYRSINLRVYFMFYGGSVEEQRYLSVVRKEKDAFTRLIREKGNMALVLSHDGRGIEDPQEQFLRTLNTRIAGGGRIKATAEPPRIIVDVREFRSSLPSLLHGRNQQIIPCQLTVGDYILSPTMCVERKSIKDLIGSFQNGRLFNQCEQMVQFYRTPIVLIEFDQNKSFNLEPFVNFESGNIDMTHLQSKLVLLTLSFPSVKFIWSSSPYATAEIFEDLKRSNEEPDPLASVMYGVVESTDVEKTINQAAVDLLESMPGVSGKNSWNISSRVENVRELARVGVAEMIEMIGPENGRTLHRFLNKDVTG